MPKITITTFEGKPYDLNNNHTSLVCFVETETESIIQSLSASIAFIAENIIDTIDIVIFSSYPEKFQEGALSSSNIITAHYDEFAIKRPQSNPHFFLYDNNGSLLIDGQLSSKPEELVWLISDMIGIIMQNWIHTEIVGVNENISANSYLSFLQKYFEKSLSQIYVFVFLDDACSSCQSGQIINEINKFQMENLSLKYYIVLPSTYNENDLKNIKRNNNFLLDFIRVGKEIEDYKLSRLKTDFVSTINGITLVINKNGDVLFFADLFNEKKQYNRNDFYSFEHFLLRYSEKIQ